MGTINLNSRKQIPQSPISPKLRREDNKTLPRHVAYNFQNEITSLLMHQRPLDEHGLQKIPGEGFP